MRLSRHLVPLLGLCAAAVVSSEAMASRSRRTYRGRSIVRVRPTKYRVTAYGDPSTPAIAARCQRGQARRAASRRRVPVEAWNSDIEIMRRAKSGAVASDIYNNKIVTERSYMQTTNTRMVTFEMCGNDGLQARSSFEGQSGTCNLAPLETALANCTTYHERDELHQHQRVRPARR